MTLFPGSAGCLFKFCNLYKTVQASTKILKRAVVVLCGDIPVHLRGLTVKTGRNETYFFREDSRIIKSGLRTVLGGVEVDILSSKQSRKSRAA